MYKYVFRTYYVPAITGTLCFGLFSLVSGIVSNALLPGLTYSFSLRHLHQIWEPGGGDDPH
jgi:hypothetical protein